MRRNSVENLERYRDTQAAILVLCKAANHLYRADTLNRVELTAVDLLDDIRETLRGEEGHEIN